jgi:hypothetical protein
MEASDEPPGQFVIGRASARDHGRPIGVDCAIGIAVVPSQFVAFRNAFNVLFDAAIVLEAEVEILCAVATAGHARGGED